ncbi:MAG: polysaccharide deacetylase family protein [Synergistaceae bacterium]|nr:polysaccharide deacetylase family protein [Synergistaceae bacterium]
MNLAIKVDADTLKGYLEGVPNLLRLFSSRKIKASIFFSFGPDNSGKAIRRVFRRGFIAKMMRTKAPSTYGFKTLLYGTLLPAPLIVPSEPGIFKRAVDEGHDCGVHAWDHVLVQDKLGRMSKDEFRSLFDRAAELFIKIAGIAPLSYAAPGWQVSSASLAVIDELGLAYASDTRGRCPFLPVYGGTNFSTPQIPTTLPTMDEVLGLPGVSDETLPNLWAEGLSNEWNVLTVHAEMEGLSKIGVFEKFLVLAESRGAKFVTLREIADKADKKSIAPDGIIPGTLPGRSGTLALQMSSIPR